MVWKINSLGPAKRSFLDLHIQARHTPVCDWIASMQVPRLLVMTQPSTSLENANKAVEDTSKLSKSQKKRRKRINKGGGTQKATDSEPNKPAQDDTPMVAAAKNSTAAALNPMTKVHERLVAEGYTAKEVETAMGEMWDKEMTGYDEFDAVLAYLRGATEAQDESTAPSTAPSTTMMDEPSLNGRASEEAVEESKEEEIEDASISTASSQHLDMAARLDMVADSDDLNDSAFALNKWISEMAKQNELEEFCSGKKSRALFTLIRRSIDESSDSGIPAVLTMVTSVFLKAGMDSLSASEIKGSLRLVLQQARTAYAKNNQDAVVAERAANAICSRISALVADLLSRDDDDASKSIRHLEKEIESLSASLNSLNGHCGIAQLIQNRDVQKQVADKASTVVNIAMGSVPNNNAPLVQVSSVTKDEVLLSLVGEDGLEQMNANKRAHDAIRQKMKDAEARSSPEYQTLKQNLVAFQDERADITKKMEELKNALKLLEEKDAVLCEKIQGAEKDIAALDESSNGEMAKLQKELAVTSKATESDVSLRTLADRLAMYETTAKQTISTSSFAATNGDEDMSNVVPEKMNSYLIRARNYFRSEADCVQFLRGRVRTLETEANSLNNELEEFKSLGLATNARQVEHSLEQKVDNIKEDNRAIEALCGEAAKMRDEIADKLSKSGVDLSSMNINVLKGIASAMAELEVDLGRLSRYVETTNGYAAVSKQALNGTQSSAHVQKQSKAVATDVSPAQLASKLTWATKDNGDVKKTESLLNIQKEELLSKD